MPRKKYTSKEVMDVSFFEEDLENFDNALGEMDSLYKEIYGDLKPIKSNMQRMGKGIMPFVQEQTKSLVTLTSNKASVLNMKLNAKLKISDLELKKTKSNEGAGSDTIAIARELAKMLNNENASKKNDSHDAGIKVSSDTDMDKHLSDRFEKEISEGNIKLTDNEQVIKYEKTQVGFKVKVEGQFKRFVAVDERTGIELQDYPLTLLPDVTLLENSQIIEKEVLCKNGSKYRVF